jgi:hypothetical protein
MPLHNTSLRPVVWHETLSNTYVFGNRVGVATCLNGYDGVGGWVGWNKNEHTQNVCLPNACFRISGGRGVKGEGLSSLGRRPRHGLDRIPSLPCAFEPLPQASHSS